MISERVARLRQQSLDAKPMISTERAELLTQIYQENMGIMSPVMRRARAFQYLMEHKTIYLGPGELIVGEKGPSPKATPTYPELCCHSLQDLDILNSRAKIPFVVSAPARGIHGTRLFRSGRASPCGISFSRDDGRMESCL
jgi:formate C-acetyltransferase